MCVCVCVWVSDPHKEKYNVKGTKQWPPSQIFLARLISEVDANP